MLRNRRAALYVVTGVVALAAGLFAFAYFVLFPTSSPDKFTLSTPSATATAAPTATSTATTESGTQGWTVANGSQAGYRVREKLAFLPAKSDAVGRTSDITGAAESTGTGDSLRFSKASFKIDLTSLASDQDRRDQRIHEIGIESDRFPTATFELTKPLALSKKNVDATGRLTLHGVTKLVTIPLQVAHSTSSVEAVGSLTFPWGDFGMTAPSVAGFVSVESNATMEFHLKLKQS